jgi:hypothetical protein
MVVSAPENRVDVDRGGKAPGRIRVGVSLITVASVVVLLAAKRGALAMSLGRIAHSHWSWIPAAIALELVQWGPSP